MTVDAVAYLHSFDPPLVHGHLTPHNIFIDEVAGKAFIGDYGFEPLMKYAGLFNNYRNKYAYTAPELLVSKGSFSVGGSTECDIYSLGLILW